MSDPSTPANKAAAFLLCVVAFLVSAMMLGLARGNTRDAEAREARTARLCAFHWSHARTPNDTLSTLRECPLPEKP